MAKSWQPVTLTDVTDIVAENWWEYRTQGRKVVRRVAVGRPSPDPSGQDWYCPLLIEGVTPGWKAIYGVGPVDAMGNALLIVSTYFDEFGGVPRARKPPRRTRRGARSKGRTR